MNKRDLTNLILSIIWSLDDVNESNLLHIPASGTGGDVDPTNKN